MKYLANSLIADGIKNFKPSTIPGSMAECLPVLLSASDDLQLRLVPPIAHTISTHEKYREMDRAQISTVSGVVVRRAGTLCIRTLMVGLRRRRMACPTIS